MRLQFTSLRKTSILVIVGTNGNYVKKLFRWQISERLKLEETRLCFPISESTRMHRLTSGKMLRPILPNTLELSTKLRRKEKKNMMSAFDTFPIY